MAINCKKILSYPMSYLKDTANGISDAFLSGLWLTGVTIGLVDKSANKIKKSIIGPIEKPKHPMVIKLTEEKSEVLSNLSEDAESIEDELTKLEQSIANLEKKVKER